MEGGEFLDRLGERVGRWVGFQRVRGQKRQAEAEVWGGEDGQGLDEDVGRRLVAGEVGVELVPVMRRLTHPVSHCSWNDQSRLVFFRL